MMKRQPFIRTDWLERNARYWPDRPALTWVPEGTCWTFAQLHAEGEALAAVLAARFGLQKGDRVAILAENRPEHVLLFVACQKAGWILVPLNYRLAAPELAYQVSDSAPALLVYDAPYTGVVQRLGAVALLPLETIRTFARSGATLKSRPAIALDDPLMILYTSGTTGRPKGALITHGMIAWNAFNTIHRLDLTSRDVSFNAAPFYHTGGWNVLLTPFLFKGGHTYLLDRFDPEQILRLCDEVGMTILWGVPTMLRMLADHPRFEQTSFRTVRYAIVGGEAMPEPLIRRWHQKGVPIRQGFGMTEVGVNCFSLPEDDALRKIGSIGFPNFYVEARIVDETGREVGVDEVGELLMRGPVVTPGYWQRPEATAEAIDAEGWFHTGDLVRRDAEGYFYVVGRKKDMYISGGENVYPAEIEAVLRAHPDVADAAVVGVPDPKWGETGAAFVVPKPGRTLTAEAVQRYCRSQLAGYKVPRHVFFLEALPLGPTGKCDKQALRERARNLISR
ncbi:o-succinylbenzoate--CoA ligase [Rhodothermus marinus SG0.5JP17-172]|uniref:class I adenylate-forming enzyme family protein n=1 Tax=Rhodothermus marinus TaxID=29549 RepID=UPI000223DDCE|nr:long-chain fatty acid--CoA ligase [Rhodothermus marinus]AEN74340.1 o-succinylbenzoate--CoA ligase [Rhodothermus marinus SG0.5JP17-172]